MTIPLLHARFFPTPSLMALTFAFVFSASHAQAPVDPQHSDAITQAYQAYALHDATGSSRQAAILPRDHLLRPWVQAWAALSDPASDPAALAVFAKKFPPSLMRWRLLEESAARYAKAGALDRARIALAALPTRALGPQGRCASALADPSLFSGRGSDLLAQGSASEICSRAAAASLGPSADAFAEAFARMPPAHAAIAAAGPALASNPHAAAGLAAWSDLAQRPRWDPALPLASKEALSRQVASALGSGQCRGAILPDPARLTERGQANAARCALWTRSVPQALVYWDALAAAKPTEPRWAALSALARNRPPALGFASTSYFQLLSTVAWRARAPAPLPAADPSSKPDPSFGPPSVCRDVSAELALSLWLHGARKESSDAWRELLDRSDAPTRACLGLRADALRAHPLRIAAFAGSDYDPRAYAPGFPAAIASSAANNGLDPDLWASLARQESRYDEAAVSRSGALGLFQMMPATAGEAAALAKSEPPTRASMLDPQANSDLAAAHFSRLVAQFGGDLPWSLCAYNAGAGRCKGWRTGLAGLPMAFRIEAMPYDETRVYVERILAGWSLSSSPDPMRASFLSEGLAPAPSPAKAARPLGSKPRHPPHQPSP